MSGLKILVYVPRIIYGSHHLAEQSAVCLPDLMFHSTIDKLSSEYEQFLLKSIISTSLYLEHGGAVEVPHERESFTFIHKKSSGLRTLADSFNLPFPKEKIKLQE